MSNPILGRVEQDARNGYVGFRDHAQTPQGGYQQAPTQTYGGQQGYGQGYPQGGYQQTQPGFPQDPTVQHGGGWGGDGGRSVTLDDVLMKTGALFAVMLAVAIPSWFLAPTFGLAIWGVGLVGGLGITLYLMFAKRPVSPALAVAYAVFQGMFVGAISATYHRQFDQAITGTAGTSIFQSIVVQAVLATLCVFGAMLFLYKSGIIKVTQKFRAIVSMAVLGYFVFALVNLGYALITSTSFGIGGSGMLGIGISLFAIGLAAVTLTLDFDNIETAIQTRAPEAYSWTLALGLLATLVWLYLEILRLLGRLRSE